MTPKTKFIAKRMALIILPGSSIGAASTVEKFGEYWAELILLSTFAFGVIWFVYFVACQNWKWSDKNPNRGKDD
jgi:hypothetical protein